MSGYVVAQLDEIDEITDGRCPWRPVRHHFGITSFGVNTWTARDGRRPDHQRARRGGARTRTRSSTSCCAGTRTFELDGERVDAPAGTFVFAPPGVKRTAFAEEPGTTILALGGVAGQGVRALRLGALGAAPSALRGGRVRRGGRPRAASWSRRIPSTPSCSTTSPAARASPAARPTRSSISGARSTRSERVREFAQGDSDFDPIRDEPAFKELVGSA